MPGEVNMNTPWRRGVPTEFLAVSSDEVGLSTGSHTLNDGEDEAQLGQLTVETSVAGSEL